MSIALRMANPYAELQQIGLEVHKTILRREIPSPKSIEATLGPNAVKPYYFMHAMFHSVEYGRGRGVLDFARRDQKALQVHSFDAAFKPLYRYDDALFPSGYLLTPCEINGALLHDVPEEKGQRMRSAYVLIDAIGHLFGQDAAHDVGLLTNKNALVLDSAEGEIKRLPQITAEKVYGVLKKKKEGIKIGQPALNFSYGSVDIALGNFADYVEKTVSEGKDNLVSIIRGMREEVENTVQSLDKKREAARLEQRVVRNYDHVLSIMDKGSYVSIDDRLIMPEDSKFLLQLKLTLYDDFIGSITKDVLKQAANATSGDSYLAPSIQKVAEQTDTVANIGADYKNIVSIFSKSEINIIKHVELIGELRKTGKEYQRLQKAAEFLYNNLEASIERYHGYMKSSAGQDGKMSLEVEGTKVMVNRLEALKKRIGENKVSNGIAQWLSKVAGSFL